VDLRRLISVVQTWLPLIVLASVLAGATAFAVSSLQQKVYEGKTTLIVGQSLSAANPDYTQLLVSQGLSGTYAAVAKTRPILDEVIQKLGLNDTTDTLSARVQVDAPGNSTFVIIRARDTDPGRAAAIANELANQLIAASPAVRGRDAALQESIDRDLSATQTQIEDTQAQIQILTALERRTSAQTAELQILEGRLVSLRATFASLLPLSSGNAANVLSIVEPATASTVPVAPSTLLNTLIAAAIGLLIVAGLAFLTEQLDDTVKDADGVQDVANLSTLGTIARMTGDRGRSEIYRLVTLLYPRSSIAEGYRTLRVNVEFAAVDAPVHTLLVTSALPGEGKTVTATNLAVAFAQTGSRVLLVDADLRKPGADIMFDLPNSQGLTTMLRGDSVGPEIPSQPTEQPNLRVLTTGPLPPNPAELLGSQRMQAVLSILRESADLLIFDSPPVQTVTDAAVLSAFVDGTLLVVAAGKSRRGNVRKARETLARAGANVLGVVLNRAAIKESLHYGGYYAPAGEGPGQASLPGATQDHAAPTAKASGSN
jgi:non-specific protein-tyrosine kinase